MRYGSTAEIEAISPDLLRVLKRVDMTAQEIEEMVPVVKHVRAVRHISDHGNGEVCIPIVNGVLKKIRTTLEDFLNSGKKAAK